MIIQKGGPAMKKETVLLNILAAWMIGGAAVVTAHAATTVNYDTAWTFVYDGGKDSAGGNVYNDKFFDAKVLPNGVCRIFSLYRLPEFTN
jgi:hypothetical protein